MPETFSVIALTNGPVSQLASLYPNTGILDLLGNFAIIDAPKDVLEELITRPEILYLEYPQLLSFQDPFLVDSICGYRLPPSIPELTGSGVLIGIPDSGISYNHPDFIREDGSSRILYFWDQTTDGIFPDGYPFGSLYTGEELLERQPFLPDPSGHGTAVAGLAAGNGRASGGQYAGIAPDADLAIVKLRPIRQGLPRTIELIAAVDFLIRTALSRNQPYVISISYGTNDGNHTGTTLMEEYLNRASSFGKGLIVVGTGNEASLSSHASASFIKDVSFSLSVSPYQPQFSMQIWFRFQLADELTITSPIGEILSFSASEGMQTFSYRNENVQIAVISPTPFSSSVGFRILFSPNASYIASGVWDFRIHFQEEAEETFDAYLPSQGQINPATRFLSPSPDRTLTIPSCAARVLSVGAYDSFTETYAPFSGRGFTRLNAVKPDLAAPGVNLTAPYRSSYRTVTGTSFAAPIAAGTAALLLQWGILLGNDPFLHGERLKYFLKAGAKPLPVENKYPNQRLGYGTLCLADTFSLL